MIKNFDEILIINASAGSGKTYQLTLRYLALLFMGAHPSRILAITFTKKAAKEMKERIAKALTGLSKGDSEFCALKDAISPLYDGDVEGRAKELLWLFLSTQNRISTIDSFVQQILRKFCFYASVKHDFEIMELDEGALKRLFLASLSGEQKRALCDFLDSRGESLNRVLELFGELYANESDLSFVKARYKEWSADRFGEAKELFLEIANRFYGYLSGEDGQKFPPERFWSPSIFIKKFELLLNEKNALSEHKSYKKFSNQKSEALFLELKEATRLYYEALSNDLIKFLIDEFGVYKLCRMAMFELSNTLSFDEISKRTKEMLENGVVESDFLYFRLDGEIEHILLDEFQDTSIVQFRIIRPLIDEIISGIGRGAFRSFFMVGDPKQSIYRFRGASAGMFEGVSEYIKKKVGARAKESYLDTNYRSDKLPVEFVNGLFLGHYGESFKKQKSNSKESGFYEVACTEADELIKKCADTVSGYIERGASADDIAVLCYTNDDVESVSSELESRGIAVLRESSKSITNDRFVSLIMLFLEYLYLSKNGKSAKVQKMGFLAGAGVEESLFDSVFEEIKKENSPSKVVLKLIEEFGLSNQNSIKLLEMSLLFDDIYSFLTSKAVTAQKKISGAESAGVSVMTVHLSKGLEFLYTVVCDTTKKRANPNYKPLLTLYRDFRLADLQLVSKAISFFIPSAKEAMEEEARLSGIDTLNANYVAFTRAKKGLSILKNSSGASKFSSLELTAGAVGDIVFEQKPKIVPRNNSGYLPNVPRKKIGTQKDFLIEKLFLPDDYDSIYFGLALHSFFEYGSGGDARMALKNRYGVLLRERLESAISIASSLELKELSLGGAIHREIGISTTEDGEQRFYRIDMLIEKEESAIILDFKSSSWQRDGYKAQLQNYKNLVKNSIRKDVVSYLALNKNGILQLEEVI